MGSPVSGTPQMALTFGMLESRMETKDVLLTGNTLKATFIVVTKNNIPYAHQISHEYQLSGSAFQIKVACPYLRSQNMYCKQVFIRFRKLYENDELDYRIGLSSNDLNIENKVFGTDNGTWRLIHEKNNNLFYSFDITVVLDVVASSNSFATLHDDTELTDFELRGEDGSVHMHKAVLAACSPVLRKMLGSTWRETTEGRVDVTETSQMTLQHLKNFIYLHQLPDNGLEQLLLLALYYRIPDLEQKCVDKLVDGLTPQNACELLEFAAKHKVTRLILSILECVQNGVVKVNDIRNYLSGGCD